MKNRKERDPADWREKLMDMYPPIFGGRNDNPYKAGSLMGFGICVGDGWQLLLEQLCMQLNQVHRNYGVYCVAEQIKQKFGGLRFYFSYEVDPERVRIKTAWWKPLQEWAIQYNRWFWKPKFMHRIFTRNVTAWRLKGVSYLQIINGDTPLHYPTYLSLDNVAGKIGGYVGMAEAMSYHICETCGQPGKHNRDRHWVETICEECCKKRDRDGGEHEEAI